MLTGDVVGLCARHASDVAVLQSALYDDVETHARSDSRPWRPVSPDSAAPHAVGEPAEEWPRS
jgi:hypothetical protein